MGDSDPNAGQAALVVRGAVKRYGRVTALAGVDLTVRPGEFVALLGPNGAGKTTLFQLLSGLFTPDDGDIAVMGHDMAVDAVPALAGLGIVFQQPTLDLELSVRANLKFHAGLHGLPAGLAARRIAADLERLGLAERADAPVRALSGGQRRRVELARALLHEPRVLLMDEPTVGLDPASRRELVSLVRGLIAQRSLAVLWATHLCDEAALADRVIVLDRGAVVRDAPPAALVAAVGAADLESAFLALTGAASGARDGAAAAC
jgi:ABC-2 type transport system ATP-binding protein